MRGFGGILGINEHERDAGHAEATGHLGLTRHARIADFLTVDAPGWHECRCGWAYTSPEVLAGHWKVSTTSCGPSPKAPGYDRVVMNPPFAKQQDISHVEHALRFLRPGGLLVSVMTVGVKERLNAKAERFRKIVADRGGDFIPLPADSFREAGTGVHAVLAVIPERAR